MKAEILMVIDAVLRCRGVMSMHDLDFRWVMGLAIGFSRLPVREGVIFATGVWREARELNRLGRIVSPTALCRRCAETSGDDPPVIAMDAAGGQVQHDAPHRGFNPGTELHE